jgi:LysM domain-containing protein
MESSPTCSFCDRQAESRCGRCGQAYCPEHGGTFCIVCSDPASALPSTRLFQAALWALPICLVLGIWFLVAPPKLAGERAASPAATSQLERAAPQSTAPSRTATPSTSATPAAQDYTVRAGDTLQTIATGAGVSTTAIQQLNPSVDPDNLQVGQVLRLPAKAP